MTDSTQQLLEKARAAAEAARQLADQAQHYSDQLSQTAAAISAHGLGGGAVDPVVFRLAIFVMAVFVGYYVVWSVTPALHTPLMSVTNAISSVIVVGALLSVGVEQSGASDDGSGVARWFGFIALMLASVNIFGGFLVTERMLSMYKKKG
ncbi:proton-translocating transhydrogenase family protein [Methylocystis sp. MJC1]|jgi:NAD(P) transhydrogenase subunit alpha|uniref:NAD(P) transhydrogenase subunit alpha n=1 Tax=Methylocystis sp. MJC1 TaxID=2654282 RepID=UPI0013EBB20A|nr:NAD(P) transhydrogenase subunit alpha [Methylocystis sp. MJC1]KAF2989659.1 NAD(P) transhydrogenase subunit alpha [Methylocystis sp. MJC1]MBU6525633.1 NAD(P) transhydrogenase subunit alpha [Methylocystis sp. MJC1]UZX12107.1 proton-translocating transhydrogenase family protein [Methylocystis sp. MJC1]